MKIRVDEIPEEGIQVNADSTTEKWLKNLFIDIFGPDHIRNGDNGRVNVQLFRHEKDVTLIGGAILKFHPSCDRCLTNFQKQEQIPIHLILSPAKASKKEEDLDIEDEDYSFYKNDEIDLIDVLKEHILLAQEMTNLCNDECKGLCQTCGKNLNNGSCKCKKQDDKVSPFAVLKKIGNSKKIDKDV